MLGGAPIIALVRLDQVETVETKALPIIDADSQHTEGCVDPTDVTCHTQCTCLI